MNIDRDLVDRSLLKVGEEPLTDQDIETETSKYRNIKKFYLSTFLEALSSTPWTSAQKFIPLTADEESTNNTSYAYMYPLPVDCSKTLRLQNNDYFVIHGKTLYTNTEDAVLQYVTNGRIALVEDYLPDDDYPEYDPPVYEDKFYEYIETRLSSKLALKLSADQKLYQLLYSEAQLISSEAIKTSKDNSAADKNGDPWWGTECGLGGV